MAPALLVDSESSLVVDAKANADLLVPLNEVDCILAVEGVDVLHNHLKILLKSLQNDASSHSMTNAGVDGSRSCQLRIDYFIEDE